MAFPEPAPLPPVDDDLLAQITLTARLMADGMCPPEIGAVLIDALPDLLEELRGYRMAAAELRERRRDWQAAALAFDAGATE